MMMDDTTGLAAAGPLPPEESVEVVVVGAGPVGLTTALLLAASGVEILLVERNTGTSNEPKAISLDDESLRTLASAGVLDQVMPIITPGTGTRYYGADGSPVFQARAPVPFRLGHPFKNPFAQPALELALHAAAAAHARIEICFGTEFTALRQDRNGVAVTLTRVENGSRHIVGCRYLLACDGGRSPVRQALGIAMTGRSHSDAWLVVDTVNDFHDELYGMHHGDPRRPHVIIPGLDGRCRYEVLLFSGEAEPGDELPLEKIRALLKGLRDLRAEDVERAVVYRFHSLVADRWFDGRVYLLGDAVHMMPPFAGQGLNSGIRDAANLTWKIADVLAERLGPSALSTYEAERKPHAAATVRLSGRLGRLVMTTDAALAERRDRVISAAMATREGRTFFEEMRYRPVPDLTGGICVTDDVRSHPVGAGRMLGQPRVFDVERHGVALLDSVMGRGWCLLGVAVPPQAWENLPAIVRDVDPVHVSAGLADRLPPSATGCSRIVDVDGSMERELGALRGRFALVRPDRFVAATWLPGEHERVDIGLARFGPYSRHPLDQLTAAPVGAA